MSAEILYRRVRLDATGRLEDLLAIVEGEEEGELTADDLTIIGCASNVHPDLYRKAQRLFARQQHERAALAADGAETFASRLLHFESVDALGDVSSTRVEGRPRGNVHVQL